MKRWTDDFGTYFDTIEYYHSHWLLNEFITITTSIMNLFLHKDVNAFIQINYE